MSFAYLGCLVLAIACMVALDGRYHLFFWRDPLAATGVMVGGAAFFLAWDVLGIHFEVFFRGETSYMTGVLIARQLPLEEPFFLAFLCYVTMVLIGIAHRLLSRAAGRRAR